LTLGAILLAGNVGAWLWALAAFGSHPVLIGAALLAYVLGLRHAVDADHIAAIDNVTRNLMQQGRKPLAVGLYFSLGHSTIVILACAAIAGMSVTLRSRFSQLSDLGGVAGPTVSVGFLLLIAAANVGTLVAICRAFRVQRSEAAPRLEDPVFPGGVLVRLLRPLLRLISKPWHMYPLGFLFGLGFDTATEVGLLAIAARQASHVPLWSIMTFPALFTAGMALIDTADAALMARAYGWAFVKPRRKLAYNLVMTLVSIVVAVIVASLEALNLAAGKFAMNGGFWRWISNLNDHFGAIGALMVLFFVGCWGISLLICSTPKLREPVVEVGQSR
jgi:high-affinity nickel-transport protein